MSGGRISADAVEASCGYVFKNKNLLKRALTLSSYDGAFNNESLECLGDALLTFIVAEKYYLCGASEGEITARKQELLSDRALTPVSEELGLDGALIKDRGDDNNKKAVPSAYEALVAAIYLDGGLEAAREFALSTLRPLAQPFNFVAGLQELLQAEGRTPPPYKKIMEGTPQNPVLKVEVAVDGKVFTGEGASFAEAKKIAAERAYRYLKGEV